MQNSVYLATILVFKLAILSVKKAQTYNPRTFSHILNHIFCLVFLSFHFALNQTRNYNVILLVVSN